MNFPFFLKPKVMCCFSGSLSARTVVVPTGRNEKAIPKSDRPHTSQEANVALIFKRRRTILCLKKYWSPIAAK